MTPEGHRLFDLFIQSLREWRESLGEVAWVLLGCFLLAAIVGLLLLAHRILRGGNSRPRTHD